MNVNIILLTILLLTLLGLGVWWFLDKAERYETQLDPKLFEIRDKIAPMFTKDEQNPFQGVLEPLNHRDLLKEISLHRSNKSEAENKSRVYLCLADTNNNYYHDNMLIYVTLHELSHCICPDTDDHSPHFVEIFRQLLTRAYHFGIYNPNIPPIEDYCGYKTRKV